MDLFKIFGTIAIKNQEAINALHETTDEGEQTQSKLSSFFEKIGNAAKKVGEISADGLINNHNSQLSGTDYTKKKFQIGVVTVTDPNDSIYRYTNYETTLQCIKEKLIKTYGGHLRIRKVNNVKYLDYLADWAETNDQIISFGKNLINLEKQINASDIVTAVIPLGAKLEDSQFTAIDERLTIKSVNDDCDYIYDAVAVNRYGWHYQTVIFDDVHIASTLKEKGLKYLNESKYENLILDITAIDLNLIDVDIDRIKLLDKIRVVSEPHGLDAFFPVTKLQIHIDNPEQDRIQLGSETNLAMTDTVNKSNSDIISKIEKIPSENRILKEASDNASELIRTATHGHVVTTATEQLIMDTDDVETATKVWRWNVNGLGYSNTGYNGTYLAAITMDGQIVGTRIVAGSISADKLSAEYTTYVERSIAEAETNANNATDTKLRNYYTKNQVTTAISNSADAVLLSAKETALNYTDSALKSYLTKSEFKVKTDSIESTVSKKLNSSDLSTKIIQDYTSVKISWNKISKYIKLENSAINIYDSNNELLSSLTYRGQYFYLDGNSIGKIGTNHYRGYPDIGGLEFDIDWDCGYMGWFAKDYREDNYYHERLVYYDDNRMSLGKKGLHFKYDTYSYGHLYLTDNDRFRVYTNGCGYDGRMDFVASGDNAKIRIDGWHSQFAIYNDVDIDFYADIDMHGYSIRNQCDARLKKDIEPTQVNALEMLNSIDLKQFNWIINGKFEKIGVIAQQLQLIEPDLVVEDDKDGHLSIKTMKLIFYLIKAIQELSYAENYQKVIWEDPYTILEKNVFCKNLKQESYKLEEIIDKPKTLERK